MPQIVRLANYGMQTEKVECPTLLVVGVAFTCKQAIVWDVLHLVHEA